MKNCTYLYVRIENLQNIKPLKLWIYKQKKKIERVQDLLEREYYCIYIKLA